MEVTVSMVLTSLCSILVAIPWPVNFNHIGECPRAGQVGWLFLTLLGSVQSWGRRRSELPVLYSHRPRPAAPLACKRHEDLRWQEPNRSRARGFKSSHFPRAHVCIYRLVFPLGSVSGLVHFRPWKEVTF